MTISTPIKCVCQVGRNGSIPLHHFHAKVLNHYAIIVACIFLCYNMSMSELHPEPGESAIPSITRLIDLNDNPVVRLFHHPQEMGTSSPYTIAVGELDGNSGLFTDAGLTLPPEAWDAVAAHIRGDDLGTQISRGGYESTGVWLLTGSPAPIVVKHIPAKIVRTDMEGLDTVTRMSPERRLKTTIDVQERLKSASNSSRTLEVTPQYGCIIGPYGVRYWVEALLEGQPIMQALNALETQRRSGDTELYNNINTAGAIVAAAVGAPAGNFLFIADEIHVNLDADRPGWFGMRVTDVADLT